MNPFGKSKVSAILSLSFGLILTANADLSTAQSPDSWAPKQPPSYVNRSASIVLKGKIYVFGSDDPTLATSSFSRVYDPVADQWTTLAQLPISVGAPSVAAVGGLIYVIGGYNPDNGAIFDPSPNQVYDPSSDSWSTGSSPKVARAFGTTQAVGNKIYFMGGLPNGGSVTDANEQYDPVTDTWSIMTSMPTARNGVASAVVGNVIYVIGGSSGSSALSTVEAYDPSQNSWNTKAGMPTARSEFGAASLNGKIYAFGGGSGINEEYDPSSDTWATRASIPVAMNGNTGAAVNGSAYSIGINRTTGSTQANYAYTPLSSCTSQFSVLKCKDAVTNSLSVLPINSTGSTGASIQAIFQPNLGLSLSDAACACGVDHFNWLSIITADTDRFPDAARDQFGRLPHVPYIDPPLGGYYYECLAALQSSCPKLPSVLPTTTPIWGPPTTAAVEDSFPWYWDELFPPIGLSGFEGSVPEFMHHIDIEDQQVNFFDAPCRDKGVHVDFFTVLAGVRSGGSGAILIFPGTSFTWTYVSNSTPCISATITSDTNFLKNDGSIPTSGGNVSFNGFVSLDALPNTVLDLLQTMPVSVIPITPITSAGISPTPNAAGWNNTDVTVTLTSTSSPGGPGVKQISYSASGALPLPASTVPGTSASITINAEGITTVTFFSIDNAGNVEIAKTLTIRIDKTPPTISGSRLPGPNGNGWNNTSVTVSFQCADSLSGLTAGSPPSSTVVSNEGANQSVGGTCTDIAGNSTTAFVQGINIDKTPPVISCNANPNVLWPPNHKLVPTNLSVAVSDALSGPAGFTLNSVTSNEPDSGRGDIQGFVIGTGSTNGQLRAERLGSDSDHIYTFTYAGMDRAGNSAICNTGVSVPHDQGH